MELLKEKIKTLPNSPGVYLMKDKDENVIYVGKAKNLKKRVSQYFLRKQDHIKVRNMVSNIVDFDFFITDSEFDAFALENNLIKKYQPYYNILLKDSKTYAYIKVNLNEDFPKFEITRKINNKDKFFGPYVVGMSARDILDIINYSFPIRKCNLRITESSKPIKPCLYYDMHLCLAPCAHLVSKTAYRQSVNDAINFLKGDTQKVEQVLTKKMLDCANSENYETALAIREKLKLLEGLKKRIVVQLTQDVDYDVFSLVTNGEMSALCVMIIRGGKIQGVQSFDVVNFLEKEEAYKEFLVQYYMKHPYICDEIIIDLDKSNFDDVKEFIEKKYNKKVNITTPQIDSVKMRLVKMAGENAKLHLEKNIDKNTKKLNESLGAISQLQKDLNLKHIPKRIECYDISNTFGTYTVASMSVLINGEKAPSHYRKFKIKSVNFIDDFASMREVMARRMEELNGEDMSFSCMPDLIVIDGGKGQLSSAYEILSKYNYPNDLVSLAKRLEEVFTIDREKSIYLERGRYSLRLLQLARDEAHRFAITFNRQLRAKGMFKTGLESIEGVGPHTRRALLSQFKTLENIKNATLEDLENIKGVSKKTAKNIYDKFHN